MGQIKKDLRRFSVSCRVVKPPFCILSASSSPTRVVFIRVHPSLIPLRRSRRSWTQMKVKSWPYFSLNLHPSAQHSPRPLSHKRKTSLAVKNKKIFTFLITETIILVDGCKFSEKDGLDFTFIWVHDRRDQRSGIRDG